MLSAIMKCIICGKESEESIEHIIPEALGNKKMITKRVCKLCNSRLGAKVDCYLTNHPLVKILRLNNGLIGKKGKSIKFFDGVEKDIHSGALYSLKNGEPKILPQILKNEDGCVRIEAASFEEGVAFFKKILRRKGHKKEKITTYCEGAYCLKSDRQAPEFSKDISVNFALMDLSAVKMAYEYAHLVLGDEYLDDEVAKLFRRELYEATISEKDNIYPSEELARYVLFPISGSGIDKILEEQRRYLKMTTMNVLHTILMMKQDNYLYCILNLCMTDVLSFVVTISEDSGRYEKRMPLSLVFTDGNMEMI